jgi:hypothetical protein
VLLAAMVLGLAVMCFALSDGDFGEFVGRFTVLAGLLGVVVLISIWEKRSRGRAYQAGWETICHVLDKDHIHEGQVVKGNWKGRAFRAFATAYSLGEYGGTVVEYGVSMPTEHSGPAWTARREEDSTASRGSHLWRVRADAYAAEDRLIEAGLLLAIEQAEQKAIHVRPGTRLSYHPGTTQVAYEDRSGEPPCADDLVVHLDLVRGVVDVHDSAMAANDDDPKGGPRLRMGDPPLWLLSLWFPAALFSVVAGDRWPWTFPLFLVALAAPFLWRIRIGGTGRPPQRSRL